jgi:hypothetical protein
MMSMDTVFAQQTTTKVGPIAKIKALGYLKSYGSHNWGFPSQKM